MSWLLPLIVAANMADPVSTHIALSRPGTYEANPLLPNQAAMWSLKAGASAVEIYGVHRAWTTGHKRAAVVTTLIIVAANGWVAAHNLQQGGRPNGR